MSSLQITALDMAMSGMSKGKSAQKARKAINRTFSFKDN